MKVFNLFEIQKSFEPFKGIYDLNHLMELCNEISFAPWEVCYLLPQCFTEENFEENIELIEKNWGKRFVGSLIVDVCRGSLTEVGKYINSEWFAHVVNNGEFDPHFLKGVEVLKSHFADKEWDLYLDTK